MSIPDYVLRGLADDAIADMHADEDERHAVFLKTLPTPAHQLIDLGAVDQRITDVREELAAVRFELEGHEFDAEQLRRRSATLRTDLTELHERRHVLEARNV